MQNIREPGMRQAVFNLNTGGPDDEQFTTSMRDLVLGTSTTFGSTTFGSLVAIPALCVGSSVHEETTAMAALGDIEGRCHETGQECPCGNTPRAKKKKALCRVLCGLPEHKYGLIC